MTVAELVNAPDSNGDTPLHSLCLRGDQDVAAFLLENGARPDVKNLSGQTPLHIACLHGDLRMIKMLVEAAKKQAERAETGKETPAGEPHPTPPAAPESPGDC